MASDAAGGKTRSGRRRAGRAGAHARPPAAGNRGTPRHQARRYRRGARSARGRARRWRDLSDRRSGPLRRRSRVHRQGRDVHAARRAIDNAPLRPGAGLAARMWCARGEYRLKRTPGDFRLDQLVAPQLLDFRRLHPEQLSIDALVVVADADRAAKDPARRGRELGHDADARNRTGLLVIPLHVHLARAVLLVVRHVLARHDAVARDVVPVHVTHDFVGRAFIDPAAQQRVEFDPFHRFDVEPRLLPFGIRRIESDRADQAIVNLADRAQHHPSVLGLEAVERLKALGLVPGPLAHQPLLEVLDHRAAEGAMDRFVLRDVDRLALAEAARVGQTGQRRPQREQRRDVVTGPRRGARGRRFGKTGLVHDAAEGLAHDVVRGAADVVGMPVLAVRADVRDHQFGVDLPHRRIVEAPSGISARLRAFHPDVGALDQAQEDVAPARPAEVERYAEDVAPLLHPVGRRLALAVARLEPDTDGTPAHVADAGTLDLDDL